MLLWFLLNTLYFRTKRKSNGYLGNWCCRRWLPRKIYEILTKLHLHGVRLTRWTYLLIISKLWNIFSEHPGIDASKPFYFQKLEAIGFNTDLLQIDLDAEHLQEFDPVFYRQLINYPSEIIPIFDMATNEVFYSKIAKDNQVLDHQIQVKLSYVDQYISLL